MATQQKAWTGEEQDARVARAMRQAFEFTPAGEGTWRCDSESGASYLVSRNRCACEDHQYRSGPAGGLCKHRVALGHHLISEGGFPELPAEPTYRIVREMASERKTLASGLTKEFAERMVERAKKDPRTCLMFVVVEVED